MSEKVIVLYFVNGQMFIATEVNQEEDHINIKNPVMVNITQAGLRFANPFPLTDIDTVITINQNALVTSTVITDPKIKMSYFDILNQMKAQKAGIVPPNAPVPKQDIDKIIKG